MAKSRVLDGKQIIFKKLPIESVCPKTSPETLWPVRSITSPKTTLTNFLKPDCGFLFLLDVKNCNVVCNVYVIVYYCFININHDINL